MNPWVPAHFKSDLFEQLFSSWCCEYWTIKPVDKYLIAKTFVRWTLHLAWKGKCWLGQNLRETKIFQTVRSLFYIAALGWLSRKKIKNINWTSDKLVNFKAMYLRSTVVKKKKDGCTPPLKENVYSSWTAENFLSNLDHVSKIVLETFLAHLKIVIWNISACANCDFYGIIVL